MVPLSLYFVPLVVVVLALEPLPSSCTAIRDYCCVIFALHLQLCVLDLLLQIYLPVEDPTVNSSHLMQVFKK
ncbi:hypothetical protein DY000_02039630 [Brassica cretica]|uniref:Secreted peptide n=1 Tax=Brassica cretica TaxID=69181 RepID=A0ABQ7BAJ4_BRACR|nr:hypothetical protein DY000_02039630 [Brassica cretica]